MKSKEQIEFNLRVRCAAAVALRIRSASAILFGLALSACGGGGTSTTSPESTALLESAGAPPAAAASIASPALAPQTKRALALSPGAAAAPAIAGSIFHSLALRSDGTVWSWGEGSFGQLGDNDFRLREFPVQVLQDGGAGALTGVTAIAAGALHSLALKGDGTLWSWGTGSRGELGTGGFDTTSTAVRAWAGLTGATAVVAGAYHSLALTRDGSVWAWGRGTLGELGTGRFADEYVPQQVQNLAGVTTIAAGGAHSLALTADGGVWAWGYGVGGQLGNGGTVASSLPVRVVGAGGVGVLTEVTAIAGGDDHSLALKSDGTVWAWGAGFQRSGHLGNGSTTESPVPVQVLDAGGTAALTGVAAVSAGIAHSLALKRDGTVWAWGYGAYGQLGNGSTQDQSLPVQVANLSGVTAVAALAYSSLAIKSDGSVWAWGWGQNSKLGNGGTLDSPVPTQVLGPQGQGFLNLGGSIADTTPPTVTLTASADAYTVDQNVRITCSATDDESGVATTNCESFKRPAYLFNIGSNTVTATATDGAGNEGFGRVRFTVSVTTASLIVLTDSFVANRNAAMSLDAKLRLAEAAGIRGDSRAKAALIAAYIAELKRLPGSIITRDNAATLIRLAAYL